MEKFKKLSLTVANHPSKQKKEVVFMERILHPPQSVRSAVALIGQEFDF